MEENLQKGIVARSTYKLEKGKKILLYIIIFFMLLIGKSFI
jgi:hypothetical protein